MNNKGGKRWIDLGGDEITRWGRWEAEGEEFDLSPERIMSLLQSDFWSRIEAEAQQCDQILTQNGFPKSSQHIAYDGNGNWWDASDPASPKPEANTPGGWALGWAYAEKMSEPFSHVWYAACIAGEIYMIIDNRDSTDELHLGRICQIGALAADWKWRRNHKPAILMGRKQRKTLDDWRGTAIANQREGMMARREAIAILLREMNRPLTGGALEKYLCKRLLERFEIKASLRTIRRDLSEITRA